MGKYFEDSDSSFDKNLYYKDDEDINHWILTVKNYPTTFVTFSEYMTDEKINTYKKIDTVINFLENLNAKRSVIREREWIITSNTDNGTFVRFIFDSLKSKLEEWEEQIPSRRDDGQNEAPILPGM